MTRRCDVSQLCCVAALCVTHTGRRRLRACRIRQALRLGEEVWKNILKRRVTYTPSETIQRQPWLQKFVKVKAIVDLVDQDTYERGPERFDDRGQRVHSFTSFNELLAKEFELRRSPRRVRSRTEEDAYNSRPDTIVGMWHAPTGPSAVDPIVIVRRGTKWLCFRMEGQSKGRLTLLTSTDDLAHYMTNHARIDECPSGGGGTMTLFERVKNS